MLRQSNLHFNLENFTCKSTLMIVTIICTDPQAFVNLQAQYKTCVTVFLKERATINLHNELNCVNHGAILIAVII